MSKYLCLCGDDFKTKKIADLHIQLNDGHIMLKKTLKGRFLDWFFDLPGRRITKFSGFYMVYFVFIHHFHIDWTWWEATLIGVGMGLYIE